MIPTITELANTRDRIVHLPLSHTVVVSKEEVEETSKQLSQHSSDDEKHTSRVPENFVCSVPLYTPGQRLPVTHTGNPQTDELLKRLELSHRLTIPFGHVPTTAAGAQERTVDKGQGMQDADENEIDIDVDMDEAPPTGTAQEDENELDIDDDDEAAGVVEDSNEIDIDL